MSPTESWLPLFPLNTVLFPGGLLPLKVFETRYIDMVRECMKHDEPFGVVLIKSGREVGTAAQPETVGCLAHILHVDMPTLGVMMLRTRGGQRFRIRETRVRSDQRLEALIDLIDDDRDSPIDQAYLNCSMALKRVIDDVESHGAAMEGDAFDSPFSHPPQLDSTVWVANRWGEILPIPLKARQKLLELEDAGSRLSLVHQYLVQHNIL
jgi:Lon protease-like protein